MSLKDDIKDRFKETKDRRERQDEERDPGKSSDREAAPPIEREHETYAGVLEEDERRKRERS